MKCQSSDRRYRENVNTIKNSVRVLRVSVCVHTHRGGGGGGGGGVQFE